MHVWANPTSAYRVPPCYTDVKKKIVTATGNIGKRELRMRSQFRCSFFFYMPLDSCDDALCTGDIGLRRAIRRFSKITKFLTS